MITSNQFLTYVYLQIINHKTVLIIVKIIIWPITIYNSHNYINEASHNIERVHILPDEFHNASFIDTL